MFSKKKDLYSDWIVSFYQKLGEDLKKKKKRLHSDWIGFFCQKLGEDLKQKQVVHSTNSDGFCGVLQSANKNEI